MQKLILVGLGGFIGSSLRYATGLAVQRFFPGQSFPYETLIVNTAGCFLIGLCTGLVETNQPLKLFLVVGLFGGFTTFSTFGYESLTLGRNNSLSMMFIHLFSHNALGLLAVFAGLAISNSISS